MDYVYMLQEFVYPGESVDQGYPHWEDLVEYSDLELAWLDLDTYERNKPWEAYRIIRTGSPVANPT